MDGLASIQPKAEEMEWEKTNCVCYVPGALANVVDRRITDVAASSLRQEDGDTETSAFAPGPRSTMLPSLSGPQPDAILSRPSLQNSEETLVHTPDVAPNT